MRIETLTKPAEKIALLALFAMPIVVTCVFDRSLYNAFWIPKSCVFFVLFLILSAAAATTLLANPLHVRLLNNPMVWATLAYGGVLALSTAFSSNVGISFWGSYWRQMGIVVVLPTTWLAIHARLFLAEKRGDVKWFLIVLATFGTIYGALGLAQRYDFTPLGVRVLYNRSAGLQGNPDFYAPLLLLLLFPTVSLCAEFAVKGERIKAALFGLATLTQITAVISSMTRSAWIGMLAGLGIWFLGALIYVLRRRRKAIAWGAGGVAAALLIIFCVLFWTMPRMEAYRENPFDKLTSLLSLKSKTGRPIQRLVLWRDTLRFCGDQLASGRLLGSGPENFVKPFMPYKSLELAQISKTINYDNPHNSYLGALAKTGPLGLASYVAIFAVAVWGAHRRLSKRGDARTGLRVLGVSSAICAYGVNLASIFPTISALILLFIYAGVLAGICWPRPPLKALPRPSAAPTTTRVVIVILTVAFLTFGFLGLFNYVRLWRADWLFERGRVLIIRDTAPKTNVEESINYLRDANLVYPREAFYAHELIRALGMRAKILLGEKHRSEAMDAYKQSVSLAKRYADDTWTPDILFLTVGVNAFKMGLLDQTVYYFENALRWDRWCLAAHGSLGPIYYLRHMLGKTDDLPKAFVSAYTAGPLILRHSPHWNEGAFKKTFMYGDALLKLTNGKSPATIDKLTDALMVYAKVFDDPDIVAKVEKAAAGSTYENRVEAAKLFITARRVIANGGDQAKRRDELERLQEQLSELDVEGDVADYYRQTISDALQKK